MTIKITLNKSIPHIKRCITKRLVPMIHGSPAIGKSDIIRAIAAEARLFVIDVRLSMYDPADMNGLPFTVDKNGVRKSQYLPFDTFPLANDKPPEGYVGWLLFLDELPSAPPSVQAAAFKLILDRMVGQEKLHSMCFLAAAGNTEDDGAIVNPIPTPLQSRMIHFHVIPHFKSWMKWALAHNVDYRIASFLNFKPEWFYKFNPNHDDFTFASPRTWMFVSKLIEGAPVTEDDKALIAGCVSEAAGREFVAFTAIFDKTPKIADITSNPKGALMPRDNPSILFALAGSLSNHATAANLPAIVQYIERMPMEFQVLSFRQIMGRKKELQNEACMNEWIDKYSDELWDDE